MLDGDLVDCHGEQWVDNGRPSEDGDREHDGPFPVGASAVLMPTMR